MESAAACRRTSLPGAVDTRLFFAQVREDPLLEIEALAAGPHDTVVVVSSGGCTALSLLAEGAGRVVGVDLNRAQNCVVELKAAAVSALKPAPALAFLGAAPAPAAQRRATYQTLRSSLTPTSRAYWDAKPAAVGAGVLNSGVTEKFLRGLVRVMRATIHPPARIARLLSLRTLADQREFYDREWNSRRWRLMFSVLLNRAVFRRTYDPAFFAHVDNPSFSRHFHAVAEHGLTEVPVGNNYFLHHILTGRYPAEVAHGVPPYLATSLGGLDERLELVDGSYGDYLKTCRDGTISGFALSNICEWLDTKSVDELFAEIVRTAAPGARLVLRNFVGWTEVPERWRSVVVEDRKRGEQLISGDRSLMQRRIAVCTVNP